MINDFMTIKDCVQDASIPTSSYFILRLYKSKATKSLSQPALSALFQRGMAKSQFKRQYANYLETVSFNQQNDVYSKAIQRLHISVIPDNLPCREVQKESIMKFMRDGVRMYGSNKPLYVCGTPGK